MDITEDGTTILPNKGGIHVTPNFSQSNSNPTNLPPVHENDNNSNAHTIINNEAMPQPNSGTGSSENLAESGANNSPDAYDGTPYSQAALGITRADIEHAQRLNTPTNDYTPPKPMSQGEKLLSKRS
ncbi:unnamed protein product [[Candida] boidinii]|nr:unnamed protein product [[Candida] boidinii]